MKKLQDILYKSGATEITGSLNKDIANITFDSREVKQGSLFIAITGTISDGHNFIEMAIEKGASAIVCTKKSQITHPEVTYIVVDDSSKTLGFIAANYYNNPSSDLIITGVTGTNGKTTIVTLLFNLFRDMGFSVGMISTINNRINNTIIPSTHTTPDAISLNKLFKQMVDAGCEYVFMEVSSHAIAQNRIAGIDFKIGVFTNITHDHLDYHKTFKEYISAKSAFFTQLPKESFAITNSDDKNGMVMLQNSAAKKLKYGLTTMADYKGKIIENTIEGMQLQIDGNDIFTLLCGKFNAYNILAVYAVANLLHNNKEEILIGISKLSGAEGRFDTLKSKSGITAIIDYAHTPDALKNVLETINALRTHNEQLIAIVGAGGNRDKSKRPEMANIASLLSSKLILTSDNPRNENPDAILDDMVVGLDPAKKNNTMVITDRKQAIVTGWNLAKEGDIILIAGKGHEKYQDIAGVKHPFDDKKIISELMNIKS